MLNWSINAGDITSTTAFYERETSEFEEEHTFLDFIYAGTDHSPGVDSGDHIEYENFTHETRFSNFDGRWNYTVGIFYGDSEFIWGYPPALQPGVNDALNDFIGAPANIVPGDLIYITTQPEQVEDWPSLVR